MRIPYLGSRSCQHKKGNRPSFIKAARPEVAIQLYEKMIQQLTQELGQSIQTGEFKLSRTVK